MNKQTMKVKHYKIIYKKHSTSQEGDFSIWKYGDFSVWFNPKQFYRINLT